jgi:hypothetical protein
MGSANSRARQRGRGRETNCCSTPFQVVAIHRVNVAYIVPPCEDKALPESFPAAEQDAAPDFTLNAGLNTLVFKAVNESNEWKGSIRFTDARVNPVQGIKVTRYSSLLRPPLRSAVAPGA